MKSNKQFMILSTLGIMFVLDDHVGTNIGFLTNYFPYNSYYMPMFVFISGYFFETAKIENYRKFIRKKLNSLLVPYLLYNGFWWCVTYILRRFHFVEWWNSPLKDIIYNIFNSGIVSDISSSSWFVMMLFAVVVSYATLRRFIKAIWNDWIMLIVFILAGAWTVYLTQTIDISKLLLVLKISFFTQFYHLGYIYKKYIEKYVREKYSCILALGCASFNSVLSLIYGGTINFSMCAFMRGFLTNNYFLPLITSISGIMFWLIVSKQLVQILGSNKLINAISNNTFFIMINHLAFYNLLNIVFLKRADFDTLAFVQGAWYTYLKSSNISYFYILFALVGCVLIKVKIVDKLKKYMDLRKNNLAHILE